MANKPDKVSAENVDVVTAALRATHVVKSDGGVAENPLLTSAIKRIANKRDILNNPDKLAVIIDAATVDAAYTATVKAGKNKAIENALKA